MGFLKNKIEKQSSMKNIHLPKHLFVIHLSFILLFSACQNNSPVMNSTLQFEITFPQEKSDQALDGRLLLMLSKDDSKEPRFQITDGPTSQQAFGIDVENWKSGERQIITADAYGYPLKTLTQVPPGKYQVQALLHRYETFKRSDGHTVKLPMDRGE